MNSGPTKKSRGGARPGAGRKLIGKSKGVVITSRLPEELLVEVKTFMAENSIPCFRIFFQEALPLMKEFYRNRKMQT